MKVLPLPALQLSQWYTSLPQLSIWDGGQSVRGIAHPSYLLTLLLTDHFLSMDLRVRDPDQSTSSEQRRLGQSHALAAQSGRVQSNACHVAFGPLPRLLYLWVLQLCHGDFCLLDPRDQGCK